ncbi:hypothetical protein L486_07675 [Kwoniella mangroviensis CBS 10435]|uniref:Transcription elongation factor Eaf N-terminal domain-containing protein n=1 Tax=Kwoniella mangroviensis CBS 10435 TaxID=1331196 RepID=A0A1B9IH58_9TREE|nr:hypothetical protein L486_07675 [Kwoniella mangroviensis CBS 10435]
MAESPVPSGTYPVHFSPSINAQLGVHEKKRRRDENELIAFKYAFKPASITQNTPGQYQVSSGIGGNGQVVFDTNTGIQQVFDVREEHSKARECVLVWDDETKSFTLHALPSTLHLTLNRSTSRNKAPSVTSSTSSKSIPLAKSSTQPQNDEDDDMKSVDTTQTQEEAETPRPKKKARPSAAQTQVAPPVVTRQTKSGKGLPRKKPLESAPIPMLSSSASTSTSAKAKKTTTKKAKAGAGATGKGRGKNEGSGVVVEPPTPTKYKSSEYIEDSDEEILASESNNPPAEEEEIDEFANLLGQSLAQADEYDEDQEDEESEEEEEDEELGGARLVVGSGSGTSRPVIEDDGSEWI